MQIAGDNETGQWPMKLASGNNTYVMYSQSLCIFTLFNIISQLHVVCCALGPYPGGGVFIYYYIIIKLGIY